MLRRVLTLLLCVLPGVAFAASSNVNSLTASGAIVGSQLTYCPVGATTDYKCTFTQVDTFINAQLSQDCTATSGGVLTCLKTNNVSFGSLATVVAGTGVATAAADAINTNGGFPTASTNSIVAGAINVGGASATALGGVADVATGSYLQSGGLTTNPSYQAFGTGAQTAVDTAVNTNGGLATATTTSVVAGAINTGGGSGTAPVGLADVATGSYLQSGGVATIPSYQAFGTGAQTAVDTAINTTGGLVTQSGTLAASALLLGGGSATAITSTTTGTGVVTALASAPGASGGFALAAAPTTVGTGGTVSGAYGYYICTTTCAITLPTPAAGFQFCVRNDSTVTTVITINAITSVLFEKTTYNGYGTVTTGTMVSGGALGDKICLVGRDATHYLVGSYVGTWTNS